MKTTRTTRILVSVLSASLSTARATAAMKQTLISDVYVEDFASDDMQSYRPSDVPLNRTRARDFFRRARQVACKVLFDHYDIAPCWVEGTLKYGAEYLRQRHGADQMRRKNELANPDL
ncbi:MAG: hypothetical protein FWC42_10560 [Proteobacteria bacterium]|nr:hypothetical protein [Pseudomonadota bacterium]